MQPSFGAVFLRSIDSLEEYKQPPRRPVKLEEYMTNLHLDNKEPDEEVVRESCRVITSRLHKEACCVVDMSTDSEEDLYFPEEGPSTVNKAMKKSPHKLGSDRSDISDPAKVKP